MSNQGVNNKYFANDGSISIEAFYGPHDSLQIALDAIPNNLRQIGRKIGVKTGNRVKEYKLDGYDDTDSTARANATVTNLIPVEDTMDVGGTNNTVDNLLSSSTTDPLSANQGRILKEQIDNLDPNAITSDREIFAEGVLDGDTTTGNGINLKNVFIDFKIYPRNKSYFIWGNSYKEVKVRLISTASNQYYVGVDIAGAEYFGVRVDRDNAKTGVFPITFNYNRETDENQFSFTIWAAWNDLPQNYEYNFKANDQDAILNPKGLFEETDFFELELPSHTKDLFNNSTARVLPYLYEEGLHWSQDSKEPRTNFVLLNDHNDRPRAIQKILQWIKYEPAIDKAIPCGLLHGDMITALQTTNNNTDSNYFFTYVQEYLQALSFSDLPILWCPGNHDLGEDGIAGLTHRPSNQDLRDNFYTAMYNRLPTEYQTGFTWGTPTDALYYRCNVPNTNVVVISMNQFEYPIVDGSGLGRVLKYSGTGQYSGQTLTYGFNVYYSETQIQFIINQLQTIVANQTVLLLTHISIGTESDSVGNVNALADHNIRLRELIRAYNNHQSGSITFGAIDEIPAYTVSYDFTSNNTKSKILNFRGHEHDFDFDYLEESNGVVTTPSIQSMSVSRDSPYIDIREDNDSYTNDAADIVSIDENLKEVYVVRFGSRTTTAGSKDPMGTGDYGFNFTDRPIKL